MGSKLFVGNLPFATDEASLRKLFEESGKSVAEVAIMTDRMTGKPRGFAFITMTSDEDAKAVCESLNGTEFGGRNLVVNEAQPKAARAPQPIGGFGGGHGFGGGGGGGGFGGRSGSGGGGGSSGGGSPFPKAGGSRRKRRHKRIL